MRCICCNKALSDYEATLRNAATGDFMDMCNKCLKGLSINVEGREDLLGKQENAEEDVDCHTNDDLGPMWFEEEE